MRGARPCAGVVEVDVERPWLTVYGDEFSKETADVSLTRFLEEAVRRYGDSPAMTFGGESTSYEELLERSGRLAGALAESGVGKGDRVALMLPNVPEYVISFFAVVRIGAVVTQVNPIYVERELEHILNNSGARTIIVHESAYPRVTAVRETTPLESIVVAGEAGEPDSEFWRFLESAGSSVPEAEVDPAEDLAAIQYTGGTTGVSKGAMLTHRNILAGTEKTIELLLEDEGDLPPGGKAVAVAPLFHIFGLTMMLVFSVRQGLDMLLVPRFQPDEMMQLIERERPVMLAGVATLYMALHGYPEMERYGLDRVRLYTSGGASVPLGLLRSFERRTGRPIWEGYGLSEGAPVSFNTYLRGPVGGSIGVPVPGTDARIVDIETGERDMPFGEPGELIVKGPQVMAGYWEMPEETESALRDGWLHTGDIARMDEDGYLYIVDRKKEMINASGYKVYPREVEEVLYGHEAVVEAVVIGVPDEYRGETVKAFVVKKPESGVSAEDLASYCKERLAAYKTPKTIEFREELPKSAVGKLLKRVLVEEEREKAAANQ